MEKLAYLHAHSEYTLRDGCMSLKNYLARLEEAGYRQAALTDRHNLFGAFKFHQQAMGRGIKPVIGIDLRLQKGNIEADTGSADFLRVYVENRRGYKTLSKLLSESFRERREIPAVDIDLLAEHSEGLFFLGPDLPGAARPPFSCDEQRLRKRIENCRLLFGDRFYVEIPLYGPLNERHKKILNAAAELSCPAVFTNPAFYPRAADYELLPLRIAVQTNTKLVELPDIPVHRRNQWVIGKEDLQKWAADYQQPLKNGGELAAKCYFEFDTASMRMPVFKKDANSSEVIENLCRTGLDKREIEASDEEIEQRLQDELKVIRNMGFCDYFLIVADIVGQAKKREIMVGPGRGSAAGSLVSYLLGITDIDPFQYDLIFERFLNDQRREMPDIDLDFADRRRGEVIEYIKQRFGPEAVVQIITFGRMKARNALRAVGRIRGETQREIDRFASYLPENSSEPLRRIKDRVEQISMLIGSDSDKKEWFEQACLLEGLVRNASTHAAGVLIGEELICEELPLYYPAEDNPSAVSQFDMYDVEKLGYLKLDILGLTTLTLLEWTLERISPGERPSLDRIPDADEKTVDLLAEKSLEGVFQFETAGNRELVRKMKPENRKDIVDCIALYRPGPLQSGMVDSYLKRRRGEEDVQYLHQDLEAILADTYGLIIYQEQVMAIAREIGGFSWSKADLMRKAMGKKKAQLMTSLRREFIEGTVANGYEKSFAEELFGMLDNFAQYGFNRSHSAAYGEITYRTAYLKAHYPVPFYAALCSVKKDNRDRLARIYAEMQEDGIQLLIPDINASGVLFEVEGTSVRYGLSAIKHVGEALAEKIVEIREKKPFESAADFVRRLPPEVLRLAVFQSLVASGCFDSLGESRSKLLSGAEQILARGAQKYRELEAGQEVLFEKKEKLPPASEENWDDSRLARAQKEAIGFFPQRHPLEKYEVLYPFAWPGKIEKFLETQSFTSALA
ncbi:MAG: DNA polymerase III subunit alpha, partial [bacterium]